MQIISENLENFAIFIRVQLSGDWSLLRQIECATADLTSLGHCPRILTNLYDYQETGACCAI